jgi:hypothetical protein
MHISLRFFYITENLSIYYFSSYIGIVLISSEHLHTTAFYPYTFQNPHPTYTS